MQASVQIVHLCVCDSRQTSDSDNIVVSCGGGFGVNNQLCDKKNTTFGEIEKEILKNVNALKILFEIDKNSLINRIKTSKNRPNFDINNDIFYENINLYQSRLQSYNNLDFDVKIDTSCDSFSNVLLNEKLYCVIGDPVWHSLSPVIHNSFYKKTINKNDNFLYTKFNIKKDSFEKVLEILNLFKIQGASITSPFKKDIMKYLKKIDEESKTIDAVNTIIFDKKANGYVGYNTDWFGVVESIKQSLNNEKTINNKRVAIFGSGGGAKSAVIGCLKYTNKIALFNRTESKNADFAKKNKIKSFKLKDFNYKDYDIIINATTVGLNNANKSILPKTKLNEQIVLDMVYSPLNTKLLKNALDKGCKIVYGTEMLVFQAKKQFELFTNKTLNNAICNDVLKEIQKEEHEKCVVVCGKTIKEFIKNLNSASKYCNFVELRVDYIENLNTEDVKIIAKEIKKIREKKQSTCNKLSSFKTIFTCRLLENGGFYIKDYLTHKNLIKTAISLNTFDYFDIDVSSVERFKDLLKNKKNNWKSIISYHDFNKCLTYNNTKNLIEKMYNYGDIIKLAMTLQSASDLSVMISVLEDYNMQNKKIIFAPMCDKFTRLIAWKYGSWTNFVCLNEKQKTASGQLTIKEFDRLTSNF